MPRLTASTIALLTGLAAAACGGPLELEPMHHIGRLSSDAAVASDAGVTLVVRTAAWPGDPAALASVIPVEITFDNRSTRPLLIALRNMTMTTDAGQRLVPVPAADVRATGGTTPAADVVERALAERRLEPRERIAGFVYFQQLEDADEVTFSADLVDAETGQSVGTIEIPFAVE